MSVCECRWLQVVQSSDRQNKADDVYPANSSKDMSRLAQGGGKQNMHQK